MYVRVSFRVTVSINCSSNTVPARCRVMQNPQSAVGLYSLFRCRTLKTEKKTFDRNMPHAVFITKNNVQSSAAAKKNISHTIQYCYRAQGEQNNNTAIKTTKRITVHRP